MTIRILFFAPALLALTLASPAKSGNFIGVSNTSHTGGGGIKTFVDACGDTFPSSIVRMCASTDVLSTTLWSAIPAGASWVRPIFQPLIGTATTLVMDASGKFSTAGNLSCHGWRTGSQGLTVDEIGRFGSASCDTARPVACCFAANVGITERHYARWMAQDGYRNPWLVPEGQLPTDLFSTLDRWHATKTPLDATRFGKQLN